MRSDYETIQVEARGAVHWLTLNRPQSLNAITTQMVGELSDYFGGLFNDRDCRVVVMRGAGRAFCAGLDIKARGEGETPFGAGFGFQGFLADVYIKMRRCPQPIIALVHGAAAGGGFAFALAADVRIAGESARMNAAFIRLGLSACDMGVSYFLPRIVGLGIASELMLTGRFIHAPRALATGLVSEVVSDDALEAAVAALSRRDADHLANGPAPHQGRPRPCGRRAQPGGRDGDREPQPGALLAHRGLHRRHARLPREARAGLQGRLSVTSNKGAYP